MDARELDTAEKVQEQIAAAQAAEEAAEATGAIRVATSKDGSHDSPRMVYEAPAVRAMTEQLATQPAPVQSAARPSTPPTGFIRQAGPVGEALQPSAPPAARTQGTTS